MTVNEGFWAGVASGARPLPGWLVAMFEWSADSDGVAGGHSEVHPNGDEIHVCPQRHVGHIGPRSSSRRPTRRGCRP